ncbi:AI-2E family transporter [Aquibium sp. ELW1220]|uniref:AI-2E family transporter n=1 Tax=Aquibium sp. ELW1220 TaxID=2976766 RepID=UPI0025B0BAEB|nr:AI-2E family transporter [Aquibium sp. ELW1220]MDN2581704.1 AI-2E family transporter [Aquibium sp. ELW1220]
MRTIEDQAFLWLLLATSLAFGLVVSPYYGAVLWGVIAAILFLPVHRRLTLILRGRQGLAAVTTVVLTVLLVILPLMVVASSLAVEAAGLYANIQSGQLDLEQFVRKVVEGAPAWLTDLFNTFDLTNLAAVRDGLSRFLQALVARALLVGQSTFEFIVSLGVMLYLLFFLLRDGAGLTCRIKTAIPLRARQRDALLERFTIVAQAIIRGSLLVAAVQGALGGLIFWILGIHAPVLWAVMMAFLSLLPAVGSAIVWFPVAVYLLLSGSVWEGLVLILFGMLVIGLVDNLLRPFLIGKSTSIPDYVVLISTLGGISVFGLNGFVVGPMVAAMFIAVWDIFAATRGSLEPDQLPLAAHLPETAPSQAGAVEASGPSQARQNGNPT